MVLGKVMRLVSFLRVFLIETFFRCLVVALFFLLGSLPMASNADAASYSYYLGSFKTNVCDYGGPEILALDIIGYNESQGFAAPVYADVRVLKDGLYYKAYLDYNLPDDGSLWSVIGRAIIGCNSCYDNNGECYLTTIDCPFDLSVTTSGSFSGVSVRQAVDAANTAASNASAAKTSADAAKSEATAAKNAANTAAERVWDSAESKSAATLAKEARDKANQALTEIDNVKSIVNNIQASVGPQILKITGRNNATCTRTTSFDVVVQASGATEFRVKADAGSWSAWVPMGSSATATGISVSGAHTIYVEVRNASGATASGQMSIFKI